ncbi:MAG: type IV toxin-antitoxin system AbiEi family antitoxin [Candidatus Aminicenantes bacterium]
MSVRQKVKRSHVGVELVRRLAAEGYRIFSVNRAREYASEVGLRDTYLREALYHLRRNGWIISLRRGLYAISSSVPGVSPVHEFEVAMALVRDGAISHWSALHYHGLTEQAPRKVFVITTTEISIPRHRKSKTRPTDNGYPVGDMLFQFVQVKPERYFGIQNIWLNEARVAITDPERTLLDGLSMPQYCGDFAEAIHAFEMRRNDLNIERIVDYAIKIDTATAKRLGWVLEYMKIDPDYFEPLIALPIKGYRKLDPTGPRKGPRNSRWMIQENIPGKVNE